MKLNIATIASLNLKAITSTKTLSLKRGEVYQLGRHVEGVRIVHGLAWITAPTEFYAVKEGHEVYFSDHTTLHTISAEGKSGLIVELL
ncbi:MAG: hypothetical protein BroJett018_53310 [Chloroflexota bacterium]|nr:MAG: hypothetical protein BroJett018_53310 [Chloroflexota bacterium]